VDGATHVVGVAMLANLQTDPVESSWVANALASHLLKFCDVSL
jgi:hypothetical protein